MFGWGLAKEQSLKNSTLHLLLHRIYKKACIIQICVYRGQQDNGTEKWRLVLEKGGVILELGINSSNSNSKILIKDRSFVCKAFFEKIKRKEIVSLQVHQF